MNKQPWSEDLDPHLNPTDLEKENAALRRELAEKEKDVKRLDGLEKLLWSGQIGNGLAIFPTTISLTGERRFVLQDLGEEDGSSLGEELSETKAGLRAAIDAAIDKQLETE